MMIATQRSKESRRQRIVATLLDQLPGRFSVELGLDLESGRPRDVFLWFLASVLYGARISGAIVARTHREFIRRGLTTPHRILRIGWDGVVEVLDAGGYTRYDFKTATKLLDIMRSLSCHYGGDLNKLHEAAEHARDLDNRLKALAKGIGDVTVQIFLRELRGIWPKADPPISPLAALASDHLRLTAPAKQRTAVSQVQALKNLWKVCVFGFSDSAISSRHWYGLAETTAVLTGRTSARCNNIVAGEAMSARRPNTRHTGQGTRKLRD